MVSGSVVHYPPLADMGRSGYPTYRNSFPSLLRLDQAALGWLAAAMTIDGPFKPVLHEWRNRFKF